MIKLKPGDYVPTEGMTNAEAHGCPYPGWVCFHCSEVFTTVGGAADHFGSAPDRKPACQIKLGGERGLVMELRKVEAERDGWIESARQFANGQEFYQGIVRSVGELFGEAARTSDDGSVQEDVLALKVPEQVEALVAHVERINALVDDMLDGETLDEHNLDMNGLFSPIREATDMDWLRTVGFKLREARHAEPETNLAKLKAQWQAEAVEKANDIDDEYDRFYFARDLRRQADLEP